VRRIGELVGVDTDEAGLDAGQQAMQVGRLERWLRSEVPGQQRCDEPGETGAAAKLHLERETLALVDSHRARTCHRLAEQRARQVLLVARMAGLVDRAHQAAHEIVLAIARRQSRVLRNAAAERMGAFVEAAGFEIEAEQGHGVAAERALCGERERADWLHHRLTGLLVARCAHQRRQPRLQVAEQAIDIRARRARLVLIHQGVVR